MSFFLPANPVVLELESGASFELEDGSVLDLESSLPQVQIIDENPVYPIEYRYLLPSSFFQDEPGNFFEVLWTVGIGQQEPISLMPIYDERFISGDIANMPYFWLTKFANVHFGPNGGGNFSGPAVFDILEGPGEFELRTPE